MRDIAASAAQHGAVVSSTIGSNPAWTPRCPVATNWVDGLHTPDAFVGPDAGELISDTQVDPYIPSPSGRTTSMCLTG
jgi:hypothetical protein